MKKKKKTVIDLLKELDKSLNYLSNYFRIPGLESQDIKQELILKILEDWKKYKNKKRGKGFWFMRLRWHLLNVVKASKKNPLNNSVTISLFGKN